MATVFTIIGSAFGITAVAFYNFHHLYLGLLFTTFALISFAITLLVHFNKRKISKTEKMNIEEFTFVDPPGIFTHPKYSFPICPSCLNKTKSISAVSNGYCTVCKEPISETLVSGGAVFTVPDE